MIAFTSGFPDAGHALSRKFMAPVSKPTAAATDAVMQNADAAENSSAPPTSEQLNVSPTQSFPSPSQTVEQSQQQSEQQGDKRQRNNGDDDESHVATESQDDRDIVSYLTVSLGTPNKATVDSLTKQIRKAHSNYLDLRRQIASIKEKQSNKVNPHGWKVREVPLGINNAALEQKILEEQNLAAQKVLGHILAAKEADARQAYADRAAAITAAIDRHRASVERIIAANPDRYSDVNTASVMDHASMLMATRAIEVEVEADQAYDIKAQKRADKQLRFDEMKTSQKVQGSDDGDKAVTRNELKQWETQMEAKFKSNQPRGRPNKHTRDSSKSSHRQNPKKAVDKSQKKAIDKNQKKAIDKKSNSRSSKDNARGNQQQSRQSNRHSSPASPTASVLKRAVVNLAPTAAPVDLVEALGLGPSFRPTPPPLADKSLVKALRHFSKRVKTAAFHTLFPQPPSEQYNPKLYLPTGMHCDPHNDALDSCLDQYQSTISAAMYLSSTAPNAGNMSRSE